MKNLPSSSSFLWSAVLSIGVLATGVSHAIPNLQSSGSSGGSEYRVYTEAGISWTEARTFALGLGAGWDLVSITSAAEQAFVETLFNSVQVVDRDHFWIGLTDVTTEGTYVWSNGDAFSYSNWHSAEPSNNPGEEDYVALDYRAPGGLGGGWKWNDIPNDSYPNLQKGFVVQRVPDGGITLILLGLGLAGLAFVRRRFA